MSMTSKLFILSVLMKISDIAMQESTTKCQDWQGKTVKENSGYVPHKDKPCQTCICNKGYPVDCTLTPSCLEPPDCKMYEIVPGTCCQYNCIKPPLHPPSNHNVTVYTTVPPAASRVDNADTGLRLVASTVTSLLILGLVLFMIHRLRKRRMMVMMRRFSSEQNLPVEEDSVAYIANLENTDICYPPYDDPPPPYTPPKPPGVGELPPPYDVNCNTAQNNVGNGCVGSVGGSGSGNPSSQTDNIGAVMSREPLATHTAEGSVENNERNSSPSPSPVADIHSNETNTNINQTINTTGQDGNDQHTAENRSTDSIEHHETESRNNSDTLNTSAVSSSTISEVNSFNSPNRISDIIRQFDTGASKQNHNNDISRRTDRASLQYGPNLSVDPQYFPSFSSQTSTETDGCSTCNLSTSLDSCTLERYLDNISTTGTSTTTDTDINRGQVNSNDRTVHFGQANSQMGTPYISQSHCVNSNVTSSRPCAITANVGVQTPTPAPTPATRSTRSNSISSQYSVFSVCSETGERRKPLHLVPNDATYPTSPAFTLPPSNHLCHTETGASIVQTQENEHNQSHSSSSATGDIHNNESESPTSSEQSPQSECSPHIPASIQKIDEELGAVGGLPTTTTTDVTPKTHHKAKKRSRLERKIKRSNSKKDKQENVVNPCARSPDRIRVTIPKDPTFKQYGFIDNPEILKQNANISVAKNSSVSSEKLTRERSKSRERKTSPDRQKRRQSSGHNYQSVSPNGSPEHMTSLSHQRSRPRSRTLNDEVSRTALNGNIRVNGPSTAGQKHPLNSTSYSGQYYGCNSYV